MKLALSNLAFPHDQWPLLEHLRTLGLEGIEVAPTRLGPWESLTEGDLITYRDRLHDIGLRISSLQAILFGVRGVALLEDANAFGRMVEHLRRVATIGAALGAGVAVFGSPRQRSRGAMDAAAAFALGTDRFRVLAEAMQAEGGPCLGLEPVPAAYGGDFLPGAADVLGMVRAVAHPGLRLHLDTGCVALNGDDIGAAVLDGAVELAHFHIAEPKLSRFRNPAADHRGAAHQLTAINYSGWLSIEMLEDAAAPADATEEAVRFALATYGCGPAADRAPAASHR